MMPMNMSKWTEKKSLEASTLQKTIGYIRKFIDEEVVFPGENIKWFSSKRSSLLCEAHIEVTISEWNRL